MITLENKKLYDYIVMKDELVTEGRAISGEIDKLEVMIKRFEEKEKRLTKKAKVPKELTDRGDEIVKQMQSIDKEMGEIIKKINVEKLKAVPAEMKKEHLDLMKQREKKERDRNKIALKVQKIKDKLIPIVQKSVKPMLKDRFDDIETAKAKDGKVVITTFNHLDDFKKTFTGR